MLLLYVSCGISADLALVVLEHQGALLPCSWSAKDDLRDLPNMEATSEKTRSDAPELGVVAKMMRAAVAQVGMVGWLTFHHLRSSLVYSLTSAALKPSQGGPRASQLCSGTSGINLQRGVIWSACARSESSL